jgi:hypothetical protein
MSMSTRLVASVLFGVLVAFSVWLGLRRYLECRAHGFSLLYCATSK